MGNGLRAFLRLPSLKRLLKTSRMSSPAILDPEAIANLRSFSPDGTDDFLKEILGIFLEDTPLRIAELHSTFSAGDAAAFARAAHTIKGSSSNVGANELRALAAQLELDARQNGLAGLDRQVPELEAAFARVKAAIDQLLQR